MITVKGIVEFIFSFALFINALLFIPQLIKIAKDKTAKDVSLLTFLGFLLIQFAILLHGFITHDYLLIYGYLLSMITCGAVVTLILFYGNSIDTTPSKKEKEMVDRLALLENIIAMMPGHVYWIDKEGAYLGCNNNQAKSAGLYSRQEIIGKHNKDLPWNMNSETLPDTLDSVNKKVMESRVPILIEEPAILSDGKNATFISNKVPLYNDKNDVIGMVGISIDITEKKRLEQELAQTKYKLDGMTLVSRTIAHELRTPLAAINLASSTTIDYLDDLREAYNLALKAELPVKDILPSQFEKMAMIFSDIEAETNHANMVINMLLKNTEQLNIKNSDLTKCSIVYCVEEALRRYPFQENEKNLINWDNKQDFNFLGNELLTIHIFFNLLKNSLYYIKEAHKGKIKIWVEIGDSYNMLHFKDTGKGISADVLSNIFNQFFSNTYHGFGIGLAYCKIVMHGFGGDISCKSVEGEYTEFILSFPIWNKDKR